MEERPELKVRCFLDVRRGPADTSVDAEILRRFRDDFVKKQWPSGKRLPDLFYFPASLGITAAEGFALHAKCITADEQSVFISSANFTEAAQNRNIELGLLVHSEPLAARITNHFDTLTAAGFLKPIP
jgi:phosphatidylserine/phosphatidylglycerophosphate/cardiolipin synthase-like enzyme